MVSCVSMRHFFVFAADSVDNSFDVDYTYMTEDDFYNDYVRSDGEVNVEKENTELNSVISQGTVFKSDMKTYFQNLYTYSPINSHGSCGFVSFIQYLTYYDTFYNDSIVQEEYEKKSVNSNSTIEALSVSPGVLRQEYPSANLYSYIQNNKSIDFQMYLMDLYNDSLNRTPEEYKCSIGMWDYGRILDRLLANNTSTFEYRRAISFGSSYNPKSPAVVEWFDNYTKTQLDNDKPVMLHIAQYNETNGKYENYHSVVAYYYDEEGIHANFGW